MKVIELSSLGLLTVDQAAVCRGCSASTIVRAVKRGDIPCIPLGTGRGATFLLLKTDVDGYNPRRRGAPAGNQFAKKPDAPKPTKTSTSRKSGRKSRNG